MASASTSTESFQHAVYLISETKMEILSVHPSKENADKWAKYYCTKQYRNVETFTRDHEQVPKLLKEHNFDKYYKSFWNDGVFVALPHEPVMITDSPPPECEQEHEVGQVQDYDVLADEETYRAEQSQTNNEWI